MKCISQDLTRLKFILVLRLKWANLAVWILETCLEAVLNLFL